MKGTLNVLGFDFGASSGRAMLGQLKDGKIELNEIHRFSNDPVILNGRFVWDVPRLFFEMKQALVKIANMGIELDGIGVDTWGVDFGLIDKNGNLAALPVHYRDHHTDGMMEKAYEIMPKKDIFDKTGLAFLQFNTLYQLFALKDDPAMQIADKMALMPDLLMYLLTGELATEYTIASTGQLIDPTTRDWAWDIIRKFGFKESLFTEIQPAGSVRGLLLKDIADEVGMKQVPVIAVGTHDTASAVAAVPAKEERFAYISSGTWSLLGAETDEAHFEDAVMKYNYTNEGGVCGKTRLLQNIMGLWIIQECKREWARKGEDVDFADLVKLAEAEEPFRSIIDVDDVRFMPTGDMLGRIQAYCRETNQPVPETKGQFSRLIYESLALKYRLCVERLENELLGHPVDVLHIVGGGSKNKMLNQFTANALRKPVVTGPSEGTVIGNLLMQAYALGEFDSLGALRECVAASFPTENYEPEGDEAAWDAAYERLVALCDK